MYSNNKKVYCDSFRKKDVVEENKEAAVKVVVEIYALVRQNLEKLESLVMNKSLWSEEINMFGYLFQQFFVNAPAVKCVKTNFDLTLF